MLRFALVSCMVMGGKGDLQTWGSYPYSMYGPVNSEEVVGTVPWKDKSCTPGNGLKCFLVL